MDNFEQKLQRQPLRQVPAEWRGEILAAAISCHSSHIFLNPQRSTLNHFVASSQSLGRTGRSLDFDFCHELFHA